MSAICRGKNNRRKNEQPLRQDAAGNVATANFEGHHKWS